MKKTTKKKPLKKSRDGEKKTRNEEPGAEEKPFDFGGLTERNLKKNLGC
jgi:hypothetical protein